MTGFFASLARQAVAPGPRIRPAMRPQTRAGLDPADEPAPASDRQSPPLGAIDTLAVTAKPAETRSEPEREPPPPGPARDLLADLSQLSTRVPLESAAERAREDAEGAPPPRLASGVARETARRDSTAPRSFTARGSSPDTAARVRPSPLAPRPARTASSAPRSAARRAEHAAADHQDAQADVHIHIGRIELTAVTTPAPPRRPPAPVKAAMPLDEYLQRRSGKTR